MEKPHVEKEYKMMISEKDYDFILNYLPLETVIQTNYYYDTGNNNIAMRIRKIDKRYLFTLKEKQNDQRNEYEFKIKRRSLDDPKIIELLEHFKINEPKYLGEMETTRSTIDMAYGQFCLDKSSYLNKVDYEIEYEFYDHKNANDKEFYDLLELLHLTYKPSKKSKFGRFKEAL